MRKCDTCKGKKPNSEFVKATTKRAKYKRHCKDCYKEKSNRWRKAKGMAHFRKVNRKSHLKNAYGIDHKTYKKILKQQNCSCAICSRKTPGKGYRHFQVDHCHKTKQIRGLLCCYCNRGLGQFKDNIRILESAVKYLKKSYNYGKVK